MPGPWEGRARAEALAQVKRLGAANGLPCCLCGESIDYRLTYPDPLSCSVQHKVPRSVRPDLTWDRSNWAPAHLVCNVRAGNGQPRQSRLLDLGLSVA